jgi:benzodiazapine receptor
MALIYIGYLFMLIGFVAYVVVLIHAFKASVGQGFLCLCIMPYAIYYLFAKYQSPKKGLITALFLGGYIIGGILYGVGIGQATSAAMKQLGDIKIEIPAKVK